MRQKIITQLNSVLFALWFIMMILLRIFFFSVKVFTSRQFCHHLLTLKLFQIGMNFFLLDHKRRYLKKKKIFWWMCKSTTWSDPCWLVPVDFTIDIVFFLLLHYYGSEQLTSNCLVTRILQNIFFCVYQKRRKKKTHTVLECHETSKWWQNFHF